MNNYGLYYKLVYICNVIYKTNRYGTK